MGSGGRPGRRRRPGPAVRDSGPPPTSSYTPDSRPTSARSSSPSRYRSGPVCTPRRHAGNAGVRGQRGGHDGLADAGAGAGDHDGTRSSACASSTVGQHVARRDRDRRSATPVRSAAAARCPRAPSAVGNSPPAHRPPGSEAAATPRTRDRRGSPTPPPTAVFAATAHIGKVGGMRLDRLAAARAPQRAPAARPAPHRPPPEPARCRR